FGFEFKQVNSIELDPINYEALKNNVETYELQNVKLYNGDTTELLEKLTQDVIYIDAPWGGIFYKDEASLKLYLSNLELSDIYNKYKNNAKLFVFKVPLNYDIIHFVGKVRNKDIGIHIHTYVSSERGKALFNVILVTR